MLSLYSKGNDITSGYLLLLIPLIMFFDMQHQKGYGMPATSTHSLMLCYSTCVRLEQLKAGNKGCLEFDAYSLVGLLIQILSEILTLQHKYIFSYSMCTAIMKLPCLPLVTASLKQWRQNDTNLLLDENVVREDMRPWLKQSWINVFGFNLCFSGVLTNSRSKNGPQAEEQQTNINLLLTLSFE